MMSFVTILLLLNFSIAVPAFLFLFKLRSVGRYYLPFLLFIWLGLINDMLSYAFIVKMQTNLVNSNIYILAEYFILLVQFAVWNRKPEKQYVLFALAGLVIWMADNVFLNDITDNNSIFRFYFSMVIVLFSLDQFNKIVIYERSPLHKNPVFLICTAFILFFATKAFLESFNLFHAGLSDLFFQRLFLMMSVINLMTNLLYSYAILCIPRKREFTLPY